METIYSVLNGNCERKDLELFPDVLNESWKDLLRTTPCLFEERLHSGELFIGSYSDGKPSGLLETISLNLQEPPSNTANFVDMAAYMARQLGDYNSITGKGHWRPKPEDPNTLLFVDLTVASDFRKSSNIHYSGPSLSDGIVNVAKTILSKRKLPSNLRFVITYTPALQGIIDFHKRQNAFDTGVLVKNARPTHKLKDVNPMCYMAPGFFAE